MKASHLRNVAPTAAVYVPTDESRIESLVFAPDPVRNLDQTPAAFSKLGQGYVGYVGDVNAEEETTHLLIAMLLASLREIKPTGQLNSTQGSPNVQRPSVLILSLHKDAAFDELNVAVYAALRSRANVTEASTKQQALRGFTSSPLPNAVLVTDAGIMDEENNQVLSKLVTYSQRRGFTIVFACQFSSFVRWPDLDALFQRLDLSWRSGSYTKMDVTVTKSVDNIDFDALTETYEYPKALFLQHVPWEESVYVPTLQYRSNETLAAFGSTLCGGCIGYAGDVNPSEHVTKLVIALCFPKISPANTENQSPVSQTAAPTPPREAARDQGPKPEVLLISFDKLSFFDGIEQQLLSALNKNAVVQEVLDAKAALKRLSAKPSPAAIILTHPSVIHNDKVIHHLIAYARAGGKVIVGSQFSNYLPLDQLKPFFQKWELPWVAGVYHRTTIALTPDRVPSPLRSSKLFPAYSAKAVHLKHVKKEHRVYAPTTTSTMEEQFGQPGAPITGSLLEETAAAWAPIGKGYVGYIGDINSEEESTRLVLEMCGVTVKPGDLGPRKCDVGTYVEAGDLKPITDTYGERLLPTRQDLSKPRPREKEVAARSVERANMSRRKRLTAEVLKEEGNKLFKEGKSAQAASKYRQAAMIYGPRPVYMSNLAAALLKMGKYIEAESAASRALFYEPKNIKARYRRGMANKGLEMYASAIEDFRSVLRQDPSSNIARTALEETLLLNHGRASSEGNPKELEENDPLWEIMTESDSSEYKHEGNNTPCRYLNHDGCNDGSQCRWKHAPDARSIRDELGRNVCMIWLVGNCILGNKCYYAHDKTYLPAGGWWNKPEQTTNLRGAVDHFNVTGNKNSDRAMFLHSVMNLQNWRSDEWMSGRFSELDNDKTTIGQRAGITVNTTQRDGRFKYEYSMSTEAMAGMAGGVDEYDDDDDEDEEDEDEEDEDEDYDEDGWDEEEERWNNCGFTNSEVHELLCQGVKPWDEDAWDVLEALHSM
ncbi:hypothetical protein EVJ58_g6978 [Rhodofomes roseus]|uniref:C3H1-type domain-containing protein n=1 Tax=Rhodofomes roseus TaxID=34475 RepID=A0A4Y9Y6V5_9APHY|nr:hypothetical protein EVJ58_g6978 [Rhodofomes roseus]